VHQERQTMNQTEKRPRIVVGVDGSPPSILALRWAGALAPLLQADIRVVTAWEFEIPPGRLTPAVADPDHVARDVCSEAVSKVFGPVPPPALELVIRQGPATKVLVDESRQAQLLILGSRGLGGLKGLLIGAVSAAVSEHAKCSVLIAHGTDLPPALAVTPGTNWDHIPQTSDKGRNHAGV
jgi:nucleotide-binding universal stress UspA family protein